MSPANRRGLHQGLMTCNKLKLNDKKTEAITVGTRLRSCVSCGEHLTLGDYENPFKPFVKRLGVFLDSSLTMSKQMSNLCRTAYLEIRRLSIIRLFLTEEANTQLVCSWILNRLDYCNSLLAGTTSEQMSRIKTRHGSEILTKIMSFMILWFWQILTHKHVFFPVYYYFVLKKKSF